MLLDIHASILQQDHANHICELEKQLSMKDFEVKLKGQIITLIQQHCELFKINPLVFENKGLYNILSKLLTKILSSVWGTIKKDLMKLIRLKLSIIDAIKPITNKGMEVDSSHWIQFAILLYSPHMICFMHPEIRRKLENELDIDIDQLEREMNEGEEYEDLNSNHDGGDFREQEHKENDNDEESNTPEIDSKSSGFGLDGTPVVWTKVKY
ncbi:hypothetical protein SERLADRAFT_409370 [Serpula lacrymans var. lacrymans S7.9]|nr:uncharacterized protein SERLADRAFT_409370 [Serpula lacrymans var. lacrymans S7.9]EGO22804.1 hypothetical protein SERLADRAFT_409370 [Serpula lacrymans var. lacrymans S7.9]